MQKDRGKEISGFCERLRAIMSEKNIDQSDIIKETGANKSNVSQWYNGKSKPRPKNIKKLADLLGCNEYWLDTGEGEPFPDPTHRAVDQWLSTEDRGPSELSEHERAIAMERLVQVGKKRLGATDNQGVQEQDFSIEEMLNDTRTVLESDTVYRQALASNIRAFKQAVINEGKMKNTDEKIDQMMKQIEALTAIVLQGQSESHEKKRAGNDI